MSLATHRRHLQYHLRSESLYTLCDYQHVREILLHERPEGSSVLVLSHGGTQLCDEVELPLIKLSILRPKLSQLPTIDGMVD